MVRETTEIRPLLEELYMYSLELHEICSAGSCVISKDLLDQALFIDC